MKKLLAMLLSLILILTCLAGCDMDITDTLVSLATDLSSRLDADNGVEVSEKMVVHEVPTEDMAGHPIQVPSHLRTVVSLLPGVTDTLIRLGMGDMRVGVDTVSARMEGIPSALQIYDMSEFQPEDVDAMLSASPGMIFVDEDTYNRWSIAPELLETDEEAGEEDSAAETVLSTLERLESAGVCVACVGELNSMADIMHMIVFVSYCAEKYDAGEKLVYTMVDKIKKVREIAAEVPNVRMVYAELQPYEAVGFGTLLDELIGVTGAQNVFLSRDGILRPTTEEMVAANPAIIVTCVGDVVLQEGETIHTVGEARMADFTQREGWQDIAAVVSGNLYYLESSLIPGAGIVDALWELGTMFYPKLYK